jgi:exopolysaccharide biosynthesis protein
VRTLFQKRFWWAITYSVILAMFAAYVVLDTFVIPKPIKTVPKPAKAITKAISVAPNPIPITPKSVPSAPETLYTRPAIAAERESTAALHTKTDSPDTKQAIVSEKTSIADTPPDKSIPTVPPVGEAVFKTENSYKDTNIHIMISTKRIAGTQVYIADIQLKGPEYLKTAFAQDVFGRNLTQRTSALATAHHAIFAINGDFCGFRNAGFVIRNDVLYRNLPRRTGDDGALVIYQDGSFKVVRENTINAEALIAKGAVQAFSFGPSLLEDGELKVNEGTEVAMARMSNPGTAIGIISPLHYIFIVSDGRTRTSVGLSLYRLAAIFKERGCQAAYNLDGGGSATMWFDGNVLNIPTDGMRYGERSVSDIVYVGYE